MSASARQQKHEEERPCWPAFHFHSVLLIFVNLWPISTSCVADMVHAVADMDCGQYRRFPLMTEHNTNTSDQVCNCKESAVVDMSRWTYAFRKSTGSTTLNCQPSCTTDCVILCYMSALAGQMDKTFVHKDSHDSLLHRLTLNACGQPWSGHCLPEWQQMECHQHQHNQPFRHSCRQFRWNSCRVQKEE